MEYIKTIMETTSFRSEMWVIMLPFAMMAIDVLTGLIFAWVSNTFMSAKMRSGLGKKVGELAVIAVGLLFTTGMEIPDAVLNGLSIYIIIMEGMSILENLDKLGVPIPGFIKKVVNNVNEALINDDYSDLMGKIAKLEAELEKYDHARQG